MIEKVCARPKVLVGVGTTYYVALFGQYLLGALAGEFAPAISSDETEALAPADPSGLMLANEIYRSPQTSAAGLGVIAAGVPVYWWMRRGGRPR